MNNINHRVVLYHEAIEFFEEYVKPCIEHAYSKDDSIAIREGWNDYVDMLNKDGEISDWQAHNWSNPY